MTEHKPDPELMPQQFTEIAEYNQTAAGLAELRDQYRGATYEVTTAAGMAAAKAARAVLRGIRVELEKTRKEIKAPALQRCNLIDTEAKRITAELVELEEPIDAQIKAEEARREERRLEVERQERERLVAIARRIEQIRMFPAGYAGAASAMIEIGIAELQKPEHLADFGDAHLPDATVARDEALAKLQEMLETTRQAEQAATQAAREAEERAQAQAAEQARLDAQRAELEQREAEQAAREREAQEAQAEADRVARENAERQQAALSEIDGIRQQVMIASTGRYGVRTGGTAKCALETLKETEEWPIDERFGPLRSVAQAAKDRAIEQIMEIYAAASERERIAAEQAERQRALDEQAEAQRAEQERLEAEHAARLAAESPPVMAVPMDPPGEQRLTHSELKLTLRGMFAIVMQSRQQCDEDGTMIAVSREALETFAERFERVIGGIETMHKIRDFGDAVYDVKERADCSDPELSSAWEHPDVVAYGEASQAVIVELEPKPNPLADLAQAVQP